MSATVLQEVPKKFGLTTTYESDSVVVPHRFEDVITLPRLRPDDRLFSLLGGEQFALVCLDDVADRLFFGGTDEQPFLVELHPEHIVELEDSEAAFYESLKPDTIKQLEAAFGSEGTRRQGDIYAYKLPLTWGEVARQQPRALRRLGIKHINREHQLFGTRHFVSQGYWMRVRGAISAGVKVDFGYNYGNEVVSGIVIAPDHAPLVLDGPHYVARSKSMIERRPAGLGD